MKKISINITKAQIVSFQVEIKDDMTFPKITAQVALISDSGETITSYSATNEEYSWNKRKPLEVSQSLIVQIIEILKELEGAVVRNINDGQLRLNNKN